MMAEANQPDILLEPLREKNDYLCVKAIIENIDNNEK
jgi:hypothetical protein